MPQCPAPSPLPCSSGPAACRFRGGWRGRERQGGRSGIDVPGSPEVLLPGGCGTRHCHCRCRRSGRRGETRGRRRRRRRRRRGGGETRVPPPPPRPGGGPRGRGGGGHGGRRLPERVRSRHLAPLSFGCALCLCTVCLCIRTCVCGGEDRAGQCRVCLSCLSPGRARRERGACVCVCCVVFYGSGRPCFRIGRSTDTPPSPLLPPAAAWQSRSSEYSSY